MVTPALADVLTVHCGACNHQWIVPMKLPIPVDRFVKATRGAVAAGCPACGAFGKSVLMGPALDEGGAR